MAMDQKFSHHNSQSQPSLNSCGVSLDLELSSGFHTEAKKPKANHLVNKFSTEEEEEEEECL
jgi:hypothetical protein